MLSLLTEATVSSVWNSSWYAGADSYDKKHTRVRTLHERCSLPLQTTPASPASGEITSPCYFSPDLQGEKNDMNLIRTEKEFCWSSKTSVFSKDWERRKRKETEGILEIESMKPVKAVGNKKLFPVSAGGEGNWRIQLDITISSLWGFNDTGILAKSIFFFYRFL